MGERVGERVGRRVGEKVGRRVGERVGGRVRERVSGWNEGMGGRKEHMVAHLDQNCILISSTMNKINITAVLTTH